ncbi:hypothetical protein F66182_2481 [Fusarium sp. NRRL 66182]|nr:hypothetical protein F66182_2481 [Fusarium sp. NRRL 66182]
MKLSTFIPATFLFGSAFGNLHNFCACGKYFKGNVVQDPYWTFNDAATKHACNRYSNAPRGKNHWNSCSDCKMDTYRLDGWSGTPACFSWGFHMGGKEWNRYCNEKGLRGYCEDAQ